MISKHSLWFAWWTGGLLAGGLLWSTQTLAQAGSDRQLLLELLNRTEQLEREVRQLRGDLELYRYRQNNLSRRLGALDGVVEKDTAESPPPGPSVSPPETITRSEPRPPAYTAPSRPGPVPGREAAPPPPTGGPSKYDFPPPAASAPPEAPARPRTPSEQGAYEAAYSNLRNGQYEQAAAGFQEFLSRYPDSPLAGSAQYWLGETYYVTRDYENAKQALIDLGVKYPSYDKLPDAMLRLGYVYEATGEPAKAREVFQKLIEAYPNSQAAARAKQRLQTRR